MVKNKKEYPKTWKQTFITLWVGSFITGLGFSMTMPFMPLFMETLGTFPTWKLNLYSSLAFCATFISQAIVSPFWGSLADQKGRKIMCLRASGAMAITIFVTGLSQNVWQIIALRFLQGALSGYVNNALALISGETPSSGAGKAMTNMQTASVSGNLLGPIVGGYIAGQFGYRVPFYIVGISMAVCFFLTLFFAKEHFTPIPKKNMKPMKEVFASLPNVKLIVSMFITTLLVQSSVMSISPIISLLVKQLMHGQGNISLMSGIVAATPGFGTLLVANRMGEKMDEIGPEKILFFGLVLETALFIPMIFVTSPWTLAVLRFFVGMGDAALLPAAQTVLSVDVAPEAFGRIFSYNQSFQAMGGVFGPLLGSMVSSWFGYSSVFGFTAILLAVNFVILAFSVDIKKVFNK